MFVIELTFRIILLLSKNGIGDDVFSVLEVASLEDEFTSALESTFTDDISALETIEEMHRGTFHPTHYLMLIVKWLLVNLYGR